MQVSKYLYIKYFLIMRKLYYKCSKFPDQFTVHIITHNMDNVAHTEI